jgi:hypothetical protein
VVLRDSSVSNVAGSTSLVVIPAVGGQDSVWRDRRLMCPAFRGVGMVDISCRFPWRTMPKEVPAGF